MLHVKDVLHAFCYAHVSLHVKNCLHVQTALHVQKHVTAYMEKCFYMCFVVTCICLHSSFNMTAPLRLIRILFFIEGPGTAQEGPERAQGKPGRPMAGPWQPRKRERCGRVRSNQAFWALLKPKNQIKNKDLRISDIKNIVKNIDGI